MKISIRLYYGIKDRAGLDRSRFDLFMAPGSDIRSLMDAVGLHDHGEVVAVVNDFLAHRTTRLTDGDVVCLFPLPSGG